MQTTVTSHRRRATYRQCSPQPLQSHKGNHVYIKDGKVNWDIATETISVEEAKDLTLRMVELEYSLP